MDTVKEKWFWMRSDGNVAPFNMALDEALLEAAQRVGAPVLRFYGWTNAAASFGYFQKFADIERATLLRPLVRRPTGGGLVPHDADWTYSFVFPTSHEWYSTTAVESYRRIHEWIRAAFAALNVETELAPCCRKSEPGQCFAGYEKFDVLWHGKKIAGAAQRRNKLGLLIQGSIQPPPVSLQRGDWESAMRGAGAEMFRAEWSQREPDMDMLARTEELVRVKYSQRSYNEKR
jgi:lipoate-protein ligase A